VPSHVASATSTTVDLSFTKTDLGIDKGFGFWIGTLIDPEQEGFSDEAPASGMTAGTLACDPSIAGKALAHSESFEAGKAKLSLKVPKTAKGKQLKVEVTISSGRESTTKISKFKVR
jgi:hypothetical protein